MKLKTGDRVRTKTKSFYNNKIGTIIGIDNMEGKIRYVVYVESVDLNLAFYGHELKAEGITWGI